MSINDPNSQSLPKPAQKSKKRGCLLWLLIGGALLFVLFLIAAFFGGQMREKMEKEADRFLREARKGQFEEAYKMTSGRFKQAMTLEEMTAFVKEKNLTAYESASWRLGNNDEAGQNTIEGEVMLDNGSTVPLSFSLVKKGDEYRIAGIRELVRHPDPQPTEDGSQDSEGSKKTLFSFNFTTADVENVRLSTNPDAKQGITKVFPDCVDAIYCIVDLVNAMDGTKVTANWYNLGEDGKLNPQKPMLTKTLVSGSPAKLTYSMVRSEMADMLPLGKYRLELLTDSKLRKTLYFNIRTATYKELKAKAESGDKSSQFRIFGMHLAKGNDVVSAEEALQFLRQSAEAGHPNAQFNLAVIYDSGQGIEKDAVESLKWYRRAAAAGNPRAQFNLARTYSTEGGKVEIEEAVRWTQKSADQGSPLSQYALGLYYLNGRGVKEDRAKAITLFEQAAQKNAEAALILGIFYKDGEGGEPDRQQARKWLKVAADQGVGAAEELLKQLNE